MIRTAARNGDRDARIAPPQQSRRGGGGGGVRSELAREDGAGLADFQRHVRGLEGQGGASVCAFARSGEERELADEIAGAGSIRRS